MELEMSKSSGSDSEPLSHEMVRLEDIIIEAMLEHYDPDRAQNAFRRLSIYHIVGFVRLTHADRIAIVKGIFKYHNYLVFELRIPPPEVERTDVAQLLITCDNWLVLRITFKEKQEVEVIDKEFDLDQLALHSRFILGGLPLCTSTKFLGFQTPPPPSSPHF